MKGRTCLLSSSTVLGRAVSGTAPRCSGMTTAASSNSFSALAAGASSGRPAAHTYSPPSAQYQIRRICLPYSTPLVRCRSLHSSSSLRRRAVPPLLPWQISMMSKNGAKGALAPVNNKGMPRDSAITYEYVTLRQEDGSMSDPIRTSELLSRLSNVESLVALALPSTNSTGDPEQDARQLQYPICRIVNLVEERKAEEQKARELRKKATMFKELEFNWSINTHDLGHWMIKLKDFLEKGFRVEVRMMRRTRGKSRRQATIEEAEELVRLIKETVASVPGAREVKEMEGELLGSAKLIYDGPAPPKDKAKKRKGAEQPAEQTDEQTEEQAEAAAGAVQN